jgi:membrane-bound ClpP family serine protease
MTPTLIILVCLVVAIGLIFLELLLPTHGLLGVLGGVAMLVAIGYGFTLNTWLGISILAAAVLLSPFVLTLAFRIYPHTPIGKRMVLTANSPTPVVDTVRTGQLGRAVTALRPMGEAEFGVITVQVISQTGMPIDAGTSLEVLSSRADGVAVVRPAAV